MVKYVKEVSTELHRAYVVQFLNSMMQIIKGVTRSMDYTIELGTINDIDELEHLYDDMNDYLERTTNYPGWKKGVYPVRENAIEGIYEKCLFVARINGRIAGSIILNHKQEPVYEKAECGIQASGAEVFVVHTFVVHPEFIRNKVGNMLMNFCLSYGREQGMRAIRLDVYEHNQPAIMLYKKCGFIYRSTVDLGLSEYGLDWFQLYEYIL